MTPPQHIQSETTIECIVVSDSVPRELGMPNLNATVVIGKNNDFSELQIGQSY